MRKIFKFKIPRASLGNAIFSKKVGPPLASLSIMANPKNGAYGTPQGGSDVAAGPIRPRTRAPPKTERFVA